MGSQNITDQILAGILQSTISESQGQAFHELFAPLQLLTKALEFNAAQDTDTNDTLDLYIGLTFAAPGIAWKLRSPTFLLFTYILPILPFVLMFDGFVSVLRTRTPNEVEAILRRCRADTSEWEMHSGRETYLWPCGYVNWIVCRPRVKV